MMSCSRVVNYTEFVIELYCNCRMPELKPSYFGFLTGNMIECTQRKEWYHDCCKKIPKKILKLILSTISVLNDVNQMPINPYLCHINSLFSIKFPKAYVCV